MRENISSNGNSPIREVDISRKMETSKKSGNESNVSKNVSKE